MFSSLTLSSPALLSFTFLLLIHFGSTAFMTGLIWLIQIVHYPLFAQVGLESHLNYHRLHVAKITWIVAPVMLIECACTFLLWMSLFNPFPMNEGPSLTLLYQLPFFRNLIWGGALILALIWLSTAFLQVPDHGKLAQIFDPSIHQHLVYTNWIRTIGWSIRLIISGGLLYLFIYTLSVNQ